jgi:hypothetical protein
MNDLLELIGNLESCPWSNWVPATLHFCEAHVCERIVAPAETWSNLAYFAAGVWLAFQGFGASFRKSLGDVRFRMGLYALIVAVCSSLFHASYTFVFETADLAAMNFLGIEMVIQGLRRLGWVKTRVPLVFAAMLFMGSFLMLLGTEGIDRLFVFSAFVAVVLWLESLIFTRERRLKKTPDLRKWLYTLGLFALASVFWITDYTGLVCTPERHWFSGHAAWHVVNAGCFLTLSSFYRSR